MRWVSGSSWTSSIELAELLAACAPCRRSSCRARRSGRPSSPRRSPAARRRWFSERLRAIRYSQGRTLIGAVVGHHRVERGGEDLLQHVLGVLARAEHVPAEGEQARLVAPDERLVGGLVAAPGERDSRSSDWMRRSGVGPRTWPWTPEWVRADASTEAVGASGPGTRTGCRSSESQGSRHRAGTWSRLAEGGGEGKARPPSLAGRARIPRCVREALRLAVVRAVVGAAALVVPGDAVVGATGVVAGVMAAVALALDAAGGRWPSTRWCGGRRGGRGRRDRLHRSLA